MILCDPEKMIFKGHKMSEKGVKDKILKNAATKIFHVEFKMRLFFLYIAFFQDVAIFSKMQRFLVAG